MIRFTKWSFKNKAAIILASFLILVMGVVSYFTLPMEFLPTADNPQVTVVVLGQGTDVESMGKTVTEPIEKAISSVKGKKGIYSTTGDGFSKVDMNFEAGTDMKQAKVDVQDALNGVKLPEGVGKPFVVQLNTDMIPIAEISISFKDGITDKNIDFAENKIIPPLQDIKGVGNVALYGKSTGEISVKLDDKKLASYHLSPQVVMTALQGQNVAAAVGEKNIDGKSSNIKVIGSLDSIQSLKDLPVAANVRLSDIATISKSAPQDTITRINGEDALIAEASKDGNSNAVKVVKDLKEKTKELTKKYDNVKVNLFFSTTDMVVNSVNSMMKEVLLGALFATIVILLFLRNLRATFITIVSIPLSLGFTLFLLSRSGVTLNILTIGGVAVAVGRLVDDSIVVIENIYRRIQKGEFSIQVVIEATKEVATAITSSTLTTVAVFLPIGLMGAGLQDFLKPFALTITYSLLSSLAVALTVVPLMSAGLLRKAKLPEHRPPVKFINTLRWSLNHKWIVLLFAGMMFIGSTGAYFMMPKGAIDSSDAELVNVTLNYPNNVPIQDVREKALQLEDYLTAQKEPKEIITLMGNSADMAQFGNVDSPTKVTYQVIMKKNMNADKFIDKINSQKDKYTGAELTAGQASLMGSSSSEITIDVTGDNLANIESATKKIENEISGMNGIEKVETNQEDKKTVYSYEVDSKLANPSQVAVQLGMMLNRMPVGTVKLDHQDTPIYLEPVLNPGSSQNLEDIQLTTPTGIVPITKVAKLVKEEKPTQILHKDGETYLRITASVDPKKLSVVSAKMNEKINGSRKVKAMKLPDGVNVYVGGASAQQSQDFTDLFTTMGISIGLVYLIMVITFKTLRAPFAILFSLPLAAIGAILGLLITRIPVDMTALLGALMLIGIVVTNAIVLIDRVKQNEQTMIIRDAILEAASVRMRPIIMTAVATVCAMLPLLFEKAQSGSLVSQSLAIVVIGGLVVSTLLTLVVIPVIYELFHFMKSKRQRLKQSQIKDSSMAG